MSGNLIQYNRGVGLWSDAYDDSRMFSSNQILDNAADGIRYEIGRNGVIEDNMVSGNGFGTGRGSGTSLWDGGGINVNTSIQRPGPQQHRGEQRERDRDPVPDPRLRAVGH